ncbi:unannotated protein [freshwater metagenome]|uniref:Unannotated protein n=1 Tax=freshwater metagenome TaxID=449393 RepID=A0A6J6PWX7_9ZZZZ
MIGFGVQARERHIRIASPCAGESAGEIVFFGEQILGSVAHAPWLDEHHFAGGRQHIGEQLIGFGEPR